MPALGRRRLQPHPGGHAHKVRLGRDSGDFGSMFDRENVDLRDRDEELTANPTRAMVVSRLAFGIAAEETFWPARTQVAVASTRPAVPVSACTQAWWTGGLGGGLRNNGRGSEMMGRERRRSN